MRGLACWFAMLVLVGASGCGQVPLNADAGNGDSTAGGACTANTRSCGAGDALYQCDENGGSLSKIEDCQYGCAGDRCNECAANTTFCSSDDLVMCDANGRIVSPQSCAFGCQMDRCNTCEPGVAYCDNASAVACGLDGTPASTTSCGAAGCTGGVCNSCEPNTTTCQSDTLVVCNGSGTVQSATACALGCGTTPNAHCKVLVPSYGVSAPSGTLPDLLVSAPTTLNLSNCSNTPSSVELTIGSSSSSLVGAPHVAKTLQNGGPPICVLRFGKITIDAGQTLTVVNDAAFGHALSLQGTGDVQISGAIVFVNNGVSPSPGLSVSVNTSSQPYTAPGAGGGGAARAGGSGGACNGCGSAQSGGFGGAAITTIDMLLLPGSRGGGVASDFLSYGNGGFGGGAIQLVSLSKVSLAATGRIVLNGKGAVGNPNIRSLGAGGGSGGTLVIEAPMVSLSAGALAVGNGGGGAGGCPVCVGLACTNADGEHGQLSSTRAAGGNCMGAGNGGYEASGPTNPSANGANSDTGGATASGGGGGGSSGFIILRGRAGANVGIAGGAIVSPSPTIGAVTAN